MNNLKTYEFGADAGSLMNAHESGLLPAHWEGAFRAMVSEMASMVNQRPRSIYVCSADEDTDARNHLGFVLARLLGEHVPGVLLVDCDFLSVGMSGIIPHRDALGFLDLLLYGTSLGVITQETAHGAKVVGAGSFGVTKKSPFAMDAFATARRYLVNQAKCVLFVGPATDDEGNLHPIAENVDLVALVRVSDGFDARISDPFEERIASIEGVEARSIRLNTTMARPAGGEARREGKEEPTLVAQVDEFVEPSAGGETTARRGGRTGADGKSAVGEPAVSTRPIRVSAREPLVDEGGFPGPRLRKGVSASRVVRVIASLVAVVAVVFVVWWLYMTRSVRERGGPTTERARPAAVAVVPPAADSSRGEGQEERRGVGTPEFTPVAGEVREATVHREVPADSVRRKTAEPAPRVVSSTPDSVLFVQSLDQFAGQHVIHVSSFKGTEKAEEEALYLLGWGFPVFLYHVDLGSKGKWYRVYVGPYATREEAMQSKIKLDENPRITSTRVSKVPG